jgi:hypothetical protein
MNLLVKRLAICPDWQLCQPSSCQIRAESRLYGALHPVALGVQSGSFVPGLFNAVLSPTMSVAIYSDWFNALSFSVAQIANTLTVIRENALS